MTDTIAVRCPVVARIEHGPPHRRRPLVMVLVDFGGGLEIAYAVQMRVRGRLALIPPEAEDGRPAVRLPADLDEQVSRLVMGAVQADPAAREYLGLPAAARRAPAPRNLLAAAA